MTEDHGRVGVAETGSRADASSPQAVSTEGFDPARERPSQHGALLGQTLADLAKAGAIGTDWLDLMCATCAFCEGCMTNQMAATGTEALNIVMGIDDAEFGCHHGLKGGQPTKRCIGAIAAANAPFVVKRAALLTLNARLAHLPERDQVRLAFDAWVAANDPHHLLDDYQRARAYAASDAQGGVQ